MKMFFLAKTFIILGLFLVGCGQKSSPKINIIERGSKDPSTAPNTDRLSDGGDSATKKPQAQTSKKQESGESPPKGDSSGPEGRLQEEGSSEIETGVFQLYYDFKSENKKDCLVASDANQITVAPCSKASNMGFSFKKVQPGSYQMISKSTGKCLKVDTKSDYRNIKGQALIQVPCSEATGESSRFTYNPLVQASKIGVMSLCIKLGMVSNAYLDECEVSWTWFTRAKI